MRFPGFEAEWRKDKFGNIVTNTSPKFNPSKANGIVKCIELEHISSKTGELLGFIDGSQSGSIKNVFSKGDVLFGKLRPYLRKYFHTPFDGVCSSEIWVLSGKSIRNAFLYQLVQTDKFVELANQSSGSKMPRADWNLVKDGSFLFPTQDEQEKISVFLNAIDKRILTQSKIIQRLETLMRNLRERLFTQEIRLKDNSGAFFADWEFTILGEVVGIQGGFSFKSELFNNGETKVLRIGDITPNIFLSEFSGVSSVENPHKKYLVSKGDFLMALSGATFGKVGKIVDEGFAYINQRVATFKTDYNREFFYQLVQTKGFTSYINSIPTASAQPNISNTDIANFKFQMPSLKEQNSIANVLSTIDAKLRIETKVLIKYRNQKKHLLKNLFI